jgi:signal transduction histidine kinase
VTQQFSRTQHLAMRCAEQVIDSDHRRLRRIIRFVLREVCEDFGGDWALLVSLTGRSATASGGRVLSSTPRSIGRPGTSRPVLNLSFMTAGVQQSFDAGQAVLLDTRLDTDAADRWQLAAGVSAGGPNTVVCPVHVNGRLSGLLIIGGTDPIAQPDVDDLAAVQWLGRVLMRSWRAAIRRKRAASESSGPGIRSAERAKLPQPEAMYQLVRRSRLRLLGKLAADLLHKLNQPLQVLMVDCDTLQTRVRRGSTNKAVMLDALDRVAESVNTTRDFVQGLGQFRRLQELDDKPVALDGLIASSIQVAWSWMAAAGVEIDCALDDSAARCVVLADVPLMVDAIANLIVNALEATARVDVPNPRVTITAEVDAETKTVSVTIRDNGPGILLDDPEHVFRDYYSTKEEETGLGLSIVRDVMTAHEGRICVNNHDGRGCSFVFTLPYRQEADVRSPESPS